MYKSTTHSSDSCDIILEEIAQMMSIDGWRHQRTSSSLRLSKEEIVITVTISASLESLLLHSSLLISVFTLLDLALLLDEAYLCQISANGVPGIDPHGEASLSLKIDVIDCDFSDFKKRLVGFVGKIRELKEKLKISQ